MAGFVQKIVPEAVRFVDTVVRYRANPVSSVLRYWDLYHRHRFSPDEIHFQRLLDPALTNDDLQQSVSKEELLAVQSKLNPRRYHSRTEDKVCFHHFCQSNRLPAPEIYALYDRDSAPETGALTVLRNAQDLERFLRDLPADTFILKPVAGVNGEGVKRLDRRATGWIDTHGETLSVHDLEVLIERSGYSKWMFQEVIVGHPELRALSSTNGLQTLRVVTVIDEMENVRILAARLRLICGNVAHDNFEFGKTGNVIAILDPSSGRIQSAVGGSSKRYEIREVTHHPVTGRLLIGFQVPNWNVAVALAMAAARAFRPLRTIGWDVAITPTAPCLIEGNVTWATLSGEPKMGEIYRYLKVVAESGAPTNVEPA